MEHENAKELAWGYGEVTNIKFMLSKHARLYI